MIVSVRTICSQVSFPECVRWTTIEFDPQCGTAQPEDALRLLIPSRTLHLSNLGGKPLIHDTINTWTELRKFSGSTGWPTTVLVLPGETRAPGKHLGKIQTVIWLNISRVSSQSGKAWCPNLSTVLSKDLCTFRFLGKNFMCCVVFLSLYFSVEMSTSNRANPQLLLLERRTCNSETVLL